MLKDISMVRYPFGFTFLKINSADSSDNIYNAQLSTRLYYSKEPRRKGIFVVSETVLFFLKWVNIVGENVYDFW